MTEKRCKRKGCRKVFPVTAEYFYRNRLRPDGFNDVCKACCKVLDRQRAMNALENPTPDTYPKQRTGQAEHRNGGAKDCLNCYVVGGCRGDSKICPKKKTRLTGKQISIYRHVAAYGPIADETLAYDLDFRLVDILADLQRMAKNGAITYSAGGDYVCEVVRQRGALIC